MKRDDGFHPAVKENMVSVNSEFIKSAYPRDKAFLIVNLDHGADDKTGHLNIPLIIRGRDPPTVRP